MSGMMSPMSFWFLNHLLEDDELIWQLDEMKSKGFKGVFIHARDGLEIPYLSSNWMEKVAVIVNHCEAIGLQAWLYDEDPYPSGSAGGLVALNRPEYHAKALFLESMDCSGGEVCFDFPIGRLVKVVAVPVMGEANAGEWIDLTEHTGQVRLDWKTSYVHHWHYYTPYEDSGNPHWRTSTARSVFRTLAALPEGEWKICAFVERDFSATPRGGYTDLLNPEAAAYFLELTHERYAAMFSGKFGTTITGMFTDEPKMLGDVAWTKGFAAYFHQLFDYEITDCLPHLFLKLNDSTDQIRRDYRYALSQLFVASYVTPIAKWCKTNHLMSTGHLSPEEDPIGQTRWTPYLMSLLKPFDFPGTDLIAGLIGSESTPLLHLGPKLVSSVAHHGNKKGALVEAFGANSWSMNFRDMKRMTDWLFVMGVTDIVMHAQFYSIDGPRKREAPPSLFYQSSMWPVFQPFCEELAALSKILREGKHRCHLLLLYPQSSFSVYYPDRKREMEGLRERMAKLQHELLTHQWDFDWVDEETLLTMSVDDGTWCSDEERYDALLVFGDHVESDVIDHCQQALSQGANVWLVGSYPQILRSTGRTEDAVVSAEPFWSLHVEEHCVIAALEASIVRDVMLFSKNECSGENPGMKPGRVRDIYMLTRVIGSHIRLFLVNAIDEWRTVNIAVHTTEVTKEVMLAPYGSTLIEWDLSGRSRQAESTINRSKAMHRAKLALAHDMPSQICDLSGHWSIRPLEDNVLVLVDWYCSSTELLSTGSPITTLAAHNLTRQPERDMQSGEHAYCRFFVESVLDKVMLVTELSALRQGCVFSVNGIMLDDKPQRKRRFDTHNYEWNVASLLRKGLNWLQVTFPDGGILTDPLRLYGNFIVSLPYVGAATGLIREAPRCREQYGLSNWTQLGYPHYSGMMVYEKEVILSNEWASGQAGKVLLLVGGIADVAHCTINGMDAGIAYSEPYGWDVSPYLQAGMNQITLQVTNSSIHTMEGIEGHSGLCDFIKLVKLNAGEM